MCRVLLDSGATRKFVGSTFAVDLALPSTELSQPVIVNLADGRNTVVKSSVQVDLGIGVTAGCGHLHPYCPCTVRCYPGGTLVYRV